MHFVPMTWWGSYHTKDMLSRLSSSEPGVFKRSPRACSTPFTSLKAWYLKNSSDLHPLTIRILVLYANTHPVTPAGDSLGPCPTPLSNKNPNISETIQIPTPKPYIFFFLMSWHIQWHWQGGPPWGAWRTLFTSFKVLYLKNDSDLHP